MNKSPLEQNLDKPLREVLLRMQQRIMTNTQWCGVKTLMNPLDFWVYQELIFEQRPEVIVEIGNYKGGSTLALAHLCDILECGRVIGIDISHNGVPDVVRNHPRITLLEGDACKCYPKVTELAADAGSALVIEDSSHTYENTLQVLRTYCNVLKVGNYFIVEDSICHHGLEVGPTPGPYEAIETFLAENPSFEVDTDRESFVITWNPNGFLRRIR